MSLDAAIRTASGRRLFLGTILGKGGEGKVFSVEGDDTIAVKIYTDGKERERLPKLRTMIAEQLAARTPFVAFPMETVVANGGVAGFTMRRVIDAKTVHQLCLPVDRKTEFPDANFRFLIHAALNFAKAVASVHNLGIVIGDVNESGALVDQKALITLIDGDSFQIYCQGRVFPCKVGKPEYTAPELHEKSLASVERNIDHDAFGVAVIIFQLLFMGRHPFSGVYRGPGEQPTIARAIHDGRFAYSPSNSISMMEPPPHVPVLTDIPVDVAQAFLRAFDRNAGRLSQLRPKPAEWVTLLDRMERSLIKCTRNSAHHYSMAARQCPWCRFEAGYGTLPFIALAPVSRSNFNLDHIIAKIDAIVGPGAAPDLVSLLPPMGKLRPSQALTEFKFYRAVRGAMALAVAGLALFLTSNQVPWGFFLLFPAGFLYFGRENDAKFRQQISGARSAWDDAIVAWNRQSGSTLFDDKKYSLHEAATRYRALPRVEREMLIALESKKRDLQFQRYLEGQKIDRARISGIGDSRKMVLRSFGVETAWDIRKHKILEVPGFGDVLAQKLLSWRKSIEKKFSFNPNAPTDPVEIKRVRIETSRRRSAIESELSRGPESPSENVVF